MFNRNARNAIDEDAFNPESVKSPFINIKKIPDSLDSLPAKLWPFCWFFLRQTGWPMVICFIAVTLGNIGWSLYPLFAREMVQVFETHQSGTDIWPALRPIVIQFIAVFVIFMMAFFYVGRHLFAHLSSAFRAMIIYQLMAYTMRHGISFFQNDFAGRISTKINDTAGGLRDNLQSTLYALNYAIITFIFTIAVVFTVHPVFTLIFLLWTVSYIVILFLMVPRILNKAKTAQNSRTRITGRMVDVIGNIFNVKIFSRRNDEAKEFLSYLNDHVRKGRSLAFSFNTMHSIIDTQIVIFFCIILSACFYLLDQGKMMISDAVLIIPLMISLSNITSWLFETLFFYFEALGNIQDGIQTLVKPFKIKDDANASILTIDKGRIEFKDVNFTYTERPVFEGLNIDIKPGQKIGLIGPSGAGKSTLVQLLLRLHDIQSGVIEIDGQDIKSVTQDSLRSHIAVIPQSSDLLHRSIRENIRYGRLEASETEVIAAAKRAHAHEFILQLQDHEGRTGYDAMVGERGVKLSGGQRQRIAIARAVLKDAPILLLDEATSALDSESERLIQESLQELMVGRTVIAIAHRLSTIAQLDRLLVMENGQIIEDGAHYELLQKNGLYARLWALQSGGFLPEG